MNWGILVIAVALGFFALIWLTQMLVGPFSNASEQPPEDRSPPIPWIDADQQAFIEQTLWSEGKIEACKKTMEIAGCDLRTAKAIVDSLEGLRKGN
jgi:ribosomal protein L7/L12